jgi:hypothetical protein
MVWQLRGDGIQAQINWPKKAQQSRGICHQEFDSIEMYENSCAFSNTQQQQDCSINRHVFSEILARRN